MEDEDKKARILASAISRLEKLEKAEDFDPLRPGSRPSPDQSLVIEDFTKVPMQYITAGNQCLPGDTLVATPTGPVQIKDIKIGDTVYSEHGTEILVEKVWDNGVQEVVDLVDSQDNILATCTLGHRWGVHVHGKPNVTVLETFALESAGALVLRLSKSENGEYTKRLITLDIKRHSTRSTNVYNLTVSTSTNLYLLANGLVTSNSGKSQIASKLVVSLARESIPGWKRPEKWGSGPISILVCARSGKQIENSLGPKILSYLDPAEHKNPTRSGNALQHIELNNGNRIIFQSLENPSIARERVQSYVAHCVWIDEQPPSMSLLAELLMRVQANRGYFLATFTPLNINAALRKMVDAAAMPYSKKYKLRTLDNPLFHSDDEKANLLASMSGLTEAEKATRLEGDWATAEGSVYKFDFDNMVKHLPDYYSRSWRHILAVDPATQSKLGLNIWAEDPTTSKWFCILAEYLEGIYVPSLIVAEVEKRAANLNIVRRVYDPEASWYLHTALSMGYTYTPVPRKSAGRKAELMAQAQESLSKGEMVLTFSNADLIAEIQEMRYRDTQDGSISNSSKYHLHDAMVYFRDLMPPPDPARKLLTPDNWGQYLTEYNYAINVARATRDPRKVAKVRSNWRKAWY